MRADLADRERAIAAAFDASEQVEVSTDRAELIESYDGVRKMIWRKVELYRQSRGTTTQVGGVQVIGDGAQITIVERIENSQIGSIGSGAQGGVSGQLLSNDATNGNVQEEATMNDETETDETGEATKEEGGIKPLPESLVQDLTTHRTLALRLALGEHPDMALIALTHALAEKTFYDFPRASVLEIQANSAHLRSFAQGINETAPARALAERHIYWTERRPKSSKDLWDFVVSLDADERMKLLAHCAALSLNAIKTPRMDRPSSLETSDKLAEAISLDMATHWTPTAESYFGRVTKAHILEAVTEAVGEDAANRIVDMKKQAMAQEAERLIAGTGWLPALLRGPEQPIQAEPEDEAYPMAAE